MAENRERNVAERATNTSTKTSVVIVTNTHIITTKLRITRRQDTSARATHGNNKSSSISRNDKHCEVYITFVTK